MAMLEQGLQAKPAFKSASEKVDATTRIAREIILQETAARDAKTARLKALRLAREAEVAAETVAATPKPKAVRAPRVKKASVSV